MLRVKNLSTAIFSLTTFLSAFLLFTIELLSTKHLLPSFGGSPSTWTTALIFFQASLLAGYTYSAQLTRLTVAKQARIHFILIITTLFAITQTGNFPISIFSQIPANIDSPTQYIIVYLSKHLGLPFLLLSTTSIITQHWYQKIHPKKTPFFLYAISNAGSLLGLLFFSFIFEPNFSNTTIQTLWVIGYLLYSSLLFLTLVITIKLSTKKIVLVGKLLNISFFKKSPKSIVLWLILPLLSSAFLTSSTAKISSSIAPIPLLWIIPLSLYLISYMITFSSTGTHKLNYSKTFIILLAVFSVLQTFGTQTTPFYTMITYLGMVFASFLSLHLWLYNNRPKNPTQLGTFYFINSLGSLIGTLIVTILAPIVFKSYEEHTIILFIITIICLHGFNKSQMPDFNFKSKSFALFFLISLILSSLTVTTTFGSKVKTKNISKYRNFYGANQVINSDHTGQNTNWLVNGSIVHGSQFTSKASSQTPTTYFSTNSGLGIIMSDYRQYLKINADNSQLNMAVVGLGVGTFAAYGHTGDKITFYELNPQVVEIANNHFSFLKDSNSDIQTVTGDGRLTLLERAKNSQPKLDILFLDAFTDDGIPTHLLTMEAFDIYLNNLKPNGLIIVHVSSRYLNLNHLLSETAYHLKLTPVELVNLTWNETTRPSQYILLTSDLDFINNSSLKDYIVPKDRANLRPWTDDHSNILSILKF